MSKADDDAKKAVQYLKQKAAESRARGASKAAREAIAANKKVSQSRGFGKKK